MSEALLCLTVAVFAAFAGGMGGALVAGLLLRGEEKRFDARLADVTDGMEAMDERITSWQRKVTKRERDARGGPRNGDLPLGEGQVFSDPKQAILARAAAAGITLRGGR